MLRILLSAVAVFVSVTPTRGAGEPFALQVIDADTGRGVPLVELETVNHVRWITDSGGFAAIDEPGLMGEEVFFSVRSHGYEFPKDGFGFRGRRFRLEPGGSATLTLKRLNIAERLYRITGQGIYRDTVLLGKEPPIPQPVLNARVFGSDSVQTALYRGKIFWFWGDTNRPNYPLGIFNTPGAVTALPGDESFDPATGIPLEYFVDEKGTVRDVCKMPGDGPTWIDGLFVLMGTDGRERLFARYAKIKPPLEAYEHGLAEFDDETESFRKRMEFPKGHDLMPGGHPFVHHDDGAEFLYFPQPLPFVRVRNTAEAVQDPAQYEAYTCLETESTATRDDAGRLVYAWQRAGIPLTPDRVKTLIQSGELRNDENPFRLIDRDSGQPVQLHSASSISWNEYRKTWTLIGLELFGTSPLGEIWYAEADRPEGPWSQGIKIVTHEKYSFYNPKQHPVLAQGGGRYVYFEGTYTATFSGNDQPTPWYDYNQIMYRLDLADPRLTLD